MTETNSFYTTETYDRNHYHYGGNISNYSFDGRLTISDVADSIIRDLRFDERCRKNSIARDRKPINRRSNTYGE